MTAPPGTSKGSFQDDPAPTGAAAPAARSFCRQPTGLPAGLTVALVDLIDHNKCIERGDFATTVGVLWKDNVVKAITCQKRAFFEPFNPQVALEI